MHYNADWGVEATNPRYQPTELYVLNCKIKL